MELFGTGVGVKEKRRKVITDLLSRCERTEVFALMRLICPNVSLMK